jgi:hypothetical protein
VVPNIAFIHARRDDKVTTPLPVLITLIMKKRAFILTAIASLTIATAQARIGWTMEQCISKYGQPTYGYETEENVYKHPSRNEPADAVLSVIRESGENWKAYIFQIGGMTIYASFYDGVVSNIAYKPDDAFTLAQAMTILNKNSSEWKKDGVDRDHVSTITEQDEDYLFSTTGHRRLLAHLGLENDGGASSYNDDKDTPVNHNAILYIAITDEIANAKVQSQRDAEEKKIEHDEEKAKQEKHQNGIDRT